MSGSECASLTALADLLRGRRFVALTGAGCSTESGIPDYRGEGQPRKRAPIQGPAFRRSAEVRKRYWARATIGWPRFRNAPPNDGHYALAHLEANGVLSGIVTQNVDGLHAAAGSKRVIELHGALRHVVCLVCNASEPRDRLQERLLALNPGFGAHTATSAPDGDAELSDERLESFSVAGCLHCDGPLMPHVVFFGDNVPRQLVDTAYEWVERADGLLVVGTSLAVFSGYRFLLHAVRRGRPVAILNVGPVRGEQNAVVRVEGRSGVVLPQLARGLIS